MFHINTAVEESSVHGQGLFARQSVPAGTIIYTAEPAKDRLYSRAELAALPTQEQKQIRHFGYFDKKTGAWHLAHDDIKFCNHSDKPNITSAGGSIVAARDIASGEELLQDYREFEELRAALRKG